MKENSIEEDIKILENLKTAIDTGCVNFGGKPIYDCGYQEAIEHILSDYKKLQEEFKQVDHECERLEEKEVRLIKENEYYKDLINALETYYNITREDLERCIKDDR